MVPRPFAPLPAVPDHPALERDILALWEDEGTFLRVRDANRGGPRFGFMDGPITANNPAGVHHGHGRTLKDVFQRYKALRGFDQRYQNGFDCQGLWVEVEVEKSLGLDSKRDIEEYGLDRFAAACRERVAHYAGVMTDQSKRLGQWMDWDNSYFTFSDTNIEYIWRFLKSVHERGWLYKGHRSTQWCPRCGTSLSQHEQAGEENYVELEHPSLYVRFPLVDRPGESLVVWTTTPWTLPANVAAAVKADAEYGRRENGEWVAAARFPEETLGETKRGEELVGWRYTGPFDDVAAQQGVEHRVIPWDEVALDEGTGIVHIAPGAGAEDFDLSRVHGLPVLAPIDESGRMLAGFPFEGMATTEVEQPVIESLRERGLLVDAGTIVHRYPICWRCKTPLVFRVVDDWFISAQEIRRPMLEANDTVEWQPPQYKKRMDDWLRNMGDWNISRKRYFGLPLPFYPCDCGHLNVIGSRAELEERATAGLDGLQELHRPWIDDVTIRCEQCSRDDVRRIVEVGDAWLDAGIVHFSTLGWMNPEWVPEGNATGSARGLTHADLPDHEYWTQWFPADWVSEMREQIRLWFYSQCFMSVALVGVSPYGKVLTYEKVYDEHGKPMHKSTGNAIELNDALERMGADAMRWLYCAQTPSLPLRFGFAMADDVKRRLLTFWNSVSFFVTYANVAGYDPDAEVGEPKPLDKWLAARTAAFVREAEDAYERYWTPSVTTAFESFVDDLSNWYIRRSRRRFWDEDATALHVLWTALKTALQVIAPVMPFLAEHLWRNLVDEKSSVFLAGWPESAAVDEELLAEVAEVRRVVELGRQARATAGLKLRQPLRRLVVAGADPARTHADEIAEELRVKDVEFGDVDASELRVKPNLPVLGPKLGASLRDVRAALEEGRFEELAGGRFRVNGMELEPNEVLVERSGKEGWAVASDDGLTVALDTTLDDELLREGRVLDLIHQVNALRRDSGLEVTDRIRLWVPDEDLLTFEERIREDTLAVSVEHGELKVEKA